MQILYIICEGKSEVNFIHKSLTTYFTNINPELCLYAITLPTGKEKGNVKKGGLASYTSTVRHIREIVAMNRPGMYTTFFDLYGVPSDIPCKSQIDRLPDPLQKAILCEQQLVADLQLSGQYTFFPHIQPYEFEALLYVNPSITAKFLHADTQSQISDEQALYKIKSSVSSPEHINDSKETSPSHRLINLKPSYKKMKTLAWTALCDIGGIRSQCAHFDSWLRKIEAI
jgi:hypothetical protein